MGNGHIWGVQFSDFFRLEDYFRFLDFKGVFLSLIFDFLKFRKWFWNQNGHIWGGSFLYFFNLWPIYRFLVLKGVFFIFWGAQIKKFFFTSECSPEPKDSENI